MEQQMIKQLDPNLECMDVKMKDKQIIMKIRSVKKEAECPYCGCSSSRIHSTYEREIQDIPTQGRQTILLVAARKLFCINPSCPHKTFSERFHFVTPNGRKTKRLVEQVLVTSTKLSSVSSSTLLRQNSIKVCKSSICDLIKKNASRCG